MLYFILVGIFFISAIFVLLMVLWIYRLRRRLNVVVAKILETTRSGTSSCLQIEVFHNALERILYRQVKPEKRHEFQEFLEIDPPQQTKAQEMIRKDRETTNSPSKSLTTDDSQ